MADDQEFEMDPAIAEAMGFSGFGTQPNKKRKFNSEEAFVDPGVDKVGDHQQPQGRGANSMPLGVRVARQGDDGGASKDDSAAVAVEGEVAEGAAPRVQDFVRGVRNTRGDVVYFMPSFIEDPWKKLAGGGFV